MTPELEIQKDILPKYNIYTDNNFDDLPHIELVEVKKS